MEIIIGLIVLGLALLFIEIFVPGGILGILGSISILVACIYSYQEFGLETALTTFGISAVLISILLIIQFKYIIPKTKIGKKLVNENAIEEKNQYLPENADNFIGKQGITLTALSPTGLIECEEEQFEAFSQDGFIVKGKPVQIVSHDNFRLIVTKA